MARRCSPQLQVMMLGVEKNIEESKGSPSRDHRVAVGVSVAVNGFGTFARLVELVDGKGRRALLCIPGAKMEEDWRWLANAL